MKRRDFLKLAGAISLAGCATTSAPAKARVVVVGGGSLAKLGMKMLGHLAKDMPLLEDCLAAVAILVGPADGSRVRMRLDASGYVPFGSFVLAGRVAAGSIQGVARDDLAPSRRFYSGGGGSVRGYGYQELGPQVVIPNPDYDPTDPKEKDPPTILHPLGGRSFNEASIEARYRFGTWGAVAFVDAGQAYESSFPKLSDLRFGAGVGVRYYTNFGPLRVDLATPLDRREGESWLAVYVSIGQAF